jgi:hypothetical protein
MAVPEETMSWKKIVILALVLLVLITAISLIKRKEMRKEGVEGILLDFPAAKIEKIELRQKDMKFIFARRDALWYLQEPLAAKADKVALESILDDFCPLKYDRLVEENARDLKSYGLDKPEIELKIFAKGMAAPTHTILLGMKNNLDSSSYAKLASNGKVVLIASYKRNNLEKNLFAFRDKKIMAFDSAAVTAMNYHYENSNFNFNKKGDQWFMDKPIFSLAQEAKVSEILSAASLLEAKAFVGTANTDARREFNLEKPLLKVELKSAAGSKKIAIGKKGDRYFAQADGFNEIFEIDKDFCEKFSLDSAAFREKKIASFYAFDVRELQFQSGSFGFTIKKNIAYAWELLKPPLQIKLNEEKINRLLTALADCEAREFVDNPKGAPEFVTAIKLQVENSQNPGQLKNMEMDFAGTKADTVNVRNPSLPYWFKVDKEILGKFPKRIADISEVIQKKTLAKNNSAK